MLAKYGPQVAASSPDEIDGLLADPERQAEQALAELRDLAHGIYPPLLADLGLRAALEAQARMAAVPVSVEAPALARYSQDVYHEGQELAFTVADDGNGFDQKTTPMGSGVQGICDRIAALGGTVEITSAPGQGTSLHGRVPATAS